MSIEPFLKLSPDLMLSADAAVQKFAWLGISGSGKTYGVGKLAEELIGAHNQVVVLDTIGNWWGLRLAANGTGAGIQIPILGGDHGDIELDPGHGKLVAQTIVGTNASMVIDVSGFTGGELRRFVIDLSLELLVESRKAPAPRHMIWEECQDLLPQKVFGEDAKVLGAVQRLIKKGRNYGWGHSLVSQRVAAVNKEVLNQCTTIFAFRTIGKLDRKSIEDWQEAHGIDEEPVKLSQLETGTCLVYSPEWLKVTTVIRIAKKWTYDASATPDFTDKPRSFTLSKVDLAKFAKNMGDAIQKAKDSDPAYLKARIAELEAATDMGAVRPVDPEYVAKLEAAERELEAVREKYEYLQSRLRDTEELIEPLARAVDAVSESFTHAMNLDAMPMHRAYSGVKRSGVTRAVESKQHHTPAHAEAVQKIRRAEPGNGVANPRVRAILTVLAQHGPLGKAKILAHAGYASSGPVSTAFGEIMREGWVAANGGVLELTAAGATYLGDYTPLPTGDRLFQQIRTGRGANPRVTKILDDLRAQYPNSTSKGDLLERIGYASSGPVSTAFGYIVKRDYAVSDGPGRLRLSDHLVDVSKRRRV